MDMQDNGCNNEGATDVQKSKPPGLVSAWISGVVVFTFSPGFLLVVSMTIGRAA